MQAFRDAFCYPNVSHAYRFTYRYPAPLFVLRGAPSRPYVPSFSHLKRSSPIHTAIGTTVPPVYHILRSAVGRTSPVLSVYLNLKVTTPAPIPTTWPRAEDASASRPATKSH